MPIRARDKTWALVGCLLLLVVSGCAGSSRSAGDYREKVAQTAQMMSSVLETARLGARSAADGRSIAPFTSVLLREMEDDGASIRSALLTRQPPGPAADALRAGISPLLGDATAVLADLRIAAFRDQPAALGRIADRIPAIVHDLDRYEDLTGT